jgi:hypothetical protein
VPTIQQFEEDKVKQQKELETQIVQEQQQPTRSSTRNSEAYSGDEEDPEDKKLSEGQKEKKEMMNKMQPDKTKPTDHVKKTKGQRVVDDPVTGEKVIIKDAKFKGKYLYSWHFSSFLTSYSQISPLNDNWTPALVCLVQRRKALGKRQRRYSTNPEPLPIRLILRISPFSHSHLLHLPLLTRS